MGRRDATVSRVWVVTSPVEMPIVVVHGRLARAFRQRWAYLVAVPVLITVAFAGLSLYAFVVPALRTSAQIHRMEGLAAAVLPAGGQSRVTGYTGGWANRSAYAFATYRAPVAALLPALGAQRVPGSWRLVSATCGGPAIRCYVNAAGNLVLTVTFRPCERPTCVGGRTQIDAVVSRAGPNAR